MDITSRFITPGILFILTLVFGLWLSLSGKPYNGILFNVHKLIALGTVILTSVQLSNIFKNTELQLTVIILIIVVGICVIALFASGAFLSIGNMDYKVMLAIHRIALSLGEQHEIQKRCCDQTRGTRRPPDYGQ